MTKPIGTLYLNSNNFGTRNFGDTILIKKARVPFAHLCRFETFAQNLHSFKARAKAEGAKEREDVGFSQRAVLFSHDRLKSPLAF